MCVAVAAPALSSSSSSSAASAGGVDVASAAAAASVTPRCRVTFASRKTRTTTSFLLAAGDVTTFVSTSEIEKDDISLEVALWGRPPTIAAAAAAHGATTETETAAPFLQNSSERAFIAHALADLLVSAEGAPVLSQFLSTMGTQRWVPPHAVELLASDPQVNLFLEPSVTAAAGGNNNTTKMLGSSISIASAIAAAASFTDPSSSPSSSSDEEQAQLLQQSCCIVARKKAKPKYHRRCPYVSASLDVRGTLRRSSLGESAWKQCGATFSTLMRFFQKSPDLFEWKTDGEKHTVIKHSGATIC